MPIHILLYYILTWVFIYLGFELFSYFQSRKLLSSIQANAAAPSYRKSFGYEDLNHNFTTLPDLLTENDFIILNTNRAASTIVFTKNSFFEREAVFYKIDFNSNKNQIQFSIYNNRFNFFYLTWFNHKKADSTLQLIENKVMKEAIAY